MHWRILFVALAAAFLTAPSLQATRSGLPVGHTGAFGQPSCDQAGCHRRGDLDRELSVRVDVGPYVPGATQRVRVIMESQASSWGFQLTARRAADTNQPAGRFASVNQFVEVRCPTGQFAPAGGCGAGTVEYVTHSSEGSRPAGQSPQRIFSFDWTAPASDVGDVVFAVAGVAADGDGGINNDVTATATRVSLYAPTHSPTLDTGGVVSAAALQREPKVISPKQLVSIWGSNLNAPGTFLEVGRVDLDPQGRLPTSLSRLSVIFLTPGDPTERLGRVVFVGDRQVNVQAPNFPIGPGGIVQVQAVINRGEGQNEIRSNLVEARVQPLAPGLFTLGASGVGEAAAVDGASGRVIATPGLGIPNSIRARPGSVILVYGTGFGASSPDFEAGDLPGEAAPLTGNASAQIGGLPADVLYAGVAPGFAGLTQYNVRVPESLPPGDHLIVLRINSFETQGNVRITVGQ
jgi:uncharacterized protein (TIGR03437 family)